MKHIDELELAEQKEHLRWMQEALDEAKKGMAIGEVPIGAVAILDGEIIARGYNLREVNQQATSHAEMEVIQKANQSLKAWRLSNATLYVTLEPCAMCAGAIILARFKQVVYGAKDPKGGCAGSLMNLLEDERFNHQPEVIYGALEEECSSLLKDFFRQLRRRNKRRKQAQKTNTSK
ncbi:tRNA adenosine(34) deaminase TadA [Dolosicoccus paucivorans]|uniref:tRNA adenosine(34) deaminase TadA n=1 Tax=Dolosicoccus paucivorans TaxID=84521 RepID=UPI00088F9CE4|nr:tRNA adenosine(34) deaminase TadA [Dolosicoccus paucivorans]SDI47076.1 tRNA-adenosine deaminase [Dolosicoccus paucivorans]